MIALECKALLCMREIPIRHLWFITRSEDTLVDLLVKQHIHQITGFLHKSSFLFLTNFINLKNKLRRNIWHEISHPEEAKRMKRSFFTTKRKTFFFRLFMLLWWWFTQRERGRIDPAVVPSSGVIHAPLHKTITQRERAAAAWMKKKSRDSKLGTYFAAGLLIMYTPTPPTRIKTSSNPFRHFRTSHPCFVQP